MALPELSRRTRFDADNVSADRLGQGARYLSDAGGVKGVAGDFFPRCEVSSRSPGEVAVGPPEGLGEVASALGVEVAEFVGRSLPRKVGGAANGEPAHVRRERMVREDAPYPLGERGASPGLDEKAGLAMPDNGAQAAHACRNDGGAAGLGLQSDEAERLGMGRDEADVGRLVVAGQLSVGLGSNE